MQKQLEVIDLDNLELAQGGNGLVKLGTKAYKWAFGARSKVPSKPVLGPDGSALASTRAPSRASAFINHPATSTAAKVGIGAAAGAAARGYFSK